jgi:hypothetical protein
MKLNTDYEQGIEFAKRIKSTQTLVNGALSMFIWCSFALTVSTILWQWL